MSRQIIEPLLKRLRATTDISPGDEQFISDLPIATKRLDGGEIIVSYGDRPSACCLVIDGFVIRSKIVADGQRQILAFHQPGDIPDLQSLFLHVLDHDVSTLNECLLGFIPHTAMRELVTSRPMIAHALWRDTLVDASIFREWICNIGQRSALSRLGHVVLEIYKRLKLIGRVDGTSFYFPATQVVFAESIGTSVVHMNRVVQELRGLGILELNRGWITILDEAKLTAVSDFDELYLHLDPSL